MTVEETTRTVEEKRKKWREHDFEFEYRRGVVSFHSVRKWSDRDVETFLPSEEEGLARLIKRKCEAKGVQYAQGACMCRIRWVELDHLNLLDEQEEQEKQPD